jgi:hypothetical protein
MLINQTNPPIPNSLSPTRLLNLTQELKSSLQAIQPDNSPLTKTITFALVATAIVGMAVYHYIKNQENQ